MAYAALRSLFQILHQTLNRDHQYLILYEKQQIESLIDQVSSLQDFLENSSQKTTKHLERKIRDASYIAEDIIESHITDRILSESASHEDGSLENISVRFKKIEKWIASSSKPASSGPSTLVSVDDFMDIKARLVRESSELDIVSIVGTGGIGKTTVASQVYHDSFIVHHFQTRAWATVSHDCNVQEVLLSLLNSMVVLTSKMHEMTSELLEERLYKNLTYQTYLIVLDDVWDTKFWDDVKQLFPNDKNGSRIMMTTRLENVANYANSCTPPHRMRFLSDSESWILFCEKVFRNYCCPFNMKEIGKKIVQHCQGLPLAIVLIGGLLSKATRTEHYWNYVAENVSSETTLTDEQYSKILSFSYKHLPSHLKWCFLYMGIFPEDYNIHVSKLVKLWVAEGIELVGSKSLEDIAEEYFMDLVERNLIMIHEKRSNGKIKTCKIHDLVRDLCVSEAEKENFFHLTNRSLQGIQEGIGMLCVSNHPNAKFRDDKILSSPQVRSLLNFDRYVPDFVPKKSSTLLRVLHQQGRLEFPNEVAKWVDLRYLDCISMHIPSSISKLQNLQTIILRPDTRPLYLSLDIWKMPQLRHVLLEYVILPDPSSVGTEGERSVFVLENLQTLSIVMNFRCTEEVIKRIPNIKKLGIHYKDEEMGGEYYYLNNLVHLRKLESLKLINFGFSFSRNLSYLTSLKKFTLVEGSLSRESMSIVGSLPNLQVLKLRRTAFFHREWITNAGEFLQLKYLQLENISLNHWRVDRTHFPNLERLVLEDCYDFEIPDAIREIPTLRSIELNVCDVLVLASARLIQKKQQLMGSDGLQVLIVNRMPTECNGPHSQWAL